MTPKEAISMILEQGISKYKIAKVMGMQPIMVDRFLQGKQTTIRREAADKLLAVWDIEIDDNYINGFTTEDFKKKHQTEMYIDEDDNTLNI